MNKIIIGIIITLSMALNIFLGWKYYEQKKEINQTKIQQQIMYLQNMELLKKVYP